MAWFGELTVLCIQVRDVAGSVWHSRQEYGVIAAELGAAFVRSAVRFAVLKCVATAFYIAGSRLANLAH